jgi:branched-chain amino acid transport system ATP-binding protein
LGTLLEINNLRVHYGKAEAVSGVSLKVNEGEVVSIIGANGAGKTTILRAISGLKKPTSGEIIFRGNHIEGKPGHAIVKMGIVHIPAGRQIFAPMTVLDNLKVGAYLRTDKDEMEKDFERVYRHFPILRKRSNQLAGSMSGGEQQMLAVGRALMTSPKLLLMDEPSIGLSPILVAEISKIIKDINKEGMTIVLVEQNARVALKISNRAYALEVGSVVLQGPSCELIDNSLVKRCYLGEEV